MAILCSLFTEKGLDVIAIQETGTTEHDDLCLSNMEVIVDTNNAANKGSSIIFRSSLNGTPMTQIS